MYIRHNVGVVSGAPFCRNLNRWRACTATQQYAWKRVSASPKRFTSMSQPGFCEYPAITHIVTHRSAYAMRSSSLIIPEEIMTFKLQRFATTPIVVPDPSSTWENYNVFNPSVIYHNGLFHMHYRAQGM